MKHIKNFLIGIYLIIAIFSTICLLSLNDFRTVELGDYTLLYIDKFSKNELFDKGDLAIVEEAEDIKVGDKIFIYNAYDKIISPRTETVSEIEKVNEKETTYHLENGKALSSNYVIGKVNGSRKIAYLGGILAAMQSKWGFLFFIVAPLLILFIYEAFAFYDDFKKEKEILTEEKKKEVKTKKEEEKNQEEIEENSEEK